MPLALSDDQMAQVLRCAEPLNPADRSSFLRDVAAELDGKELGDGLVLRRSKGITPGSTASSSLWLSLHRQGPLMKRLHSVPDEAHNFVRVDALSSLAPGDRTVWLNFM
jgi:hypothetical protein